MATPAAGLLMVGEKDESTQIEAPAAAATVIISQVVSSWIDPPSS